MKELAVLNPENATEEEIAGYELREAARAIVIDTEGELGLLHVSRDHYHKLPGGGIEIGEDRAQALRRECREEIGCDIDVIGEVGMIVEYRKMSKLKHTSYCYFARVKGEKGKPEFTESEIDRGFETAWFPYEKASELFARNEATSKEGKEYIVPRDATFLRTAKEIFDF